jgi:putative ABC transport system substrate-binding protein
MHRRSFLTLLGTSAAAWPLAAKAQQTQRMRRIGVLVNYDENDSRSQRAIASFQSALRELGWTEGRNLVIDVRWGRGIPERYRVAATELLAFEPDVLFGSGATVRHLLQATRTVPIVFANVNDPVGGGYVASLARPGGNATGFAGAEYSLSQKWLELLKQIAPTVTRVAVVREPTAAGGLGQLGALQGAANALRVELTPIGVNDVDEMQRAVAAFARVPNGGMVVTTTVQTLLRRAVIIGLADRHRLPAVYGNRIFVESGGLISYGPDDSDNWRRAAGYVDRILRGEKPADLPVQAPVKYETVLNIRTAKALGLDVPPQVLVRADEVIE